MGHIKKKKAKICERRSQIQDFFKDYSDNFTIFNCEIRKRI